MRHQPEHSRHLAELYAERRRHREEVAELVHQLDLARQREQLIAQKATALAGMALLERGEAQRLQHVVDNLHAKLLAATAPGACRRKDEECGQGGDGYKGGPFA